MWQEVNPGCPRYVAMLHPPHGIGHQIGTFTTGLIISLFFNLTYVTGGFVDGCELYINAVYHQKVWPSILTLTVYALCLAAYHGEYPDIGKFTGLTEGEHLMKDIESKVEHVIDIDSQPTNPFSDNIVELYEPLRKSFNEEHKDKCNVLFKVKVCREEILPSHHLKHRSSLCPLLVYALSPWCTGVL